MTARTLFEKVWDAHIVHRLPEGPALVYVDLHLVHEVTSPQAFAGLRAAGRKVRRPDLTVATVDHNVPTSDRTLPIADAIAARQIDTLGTNAREWGIELFDLASPQQGIVHVIGPELGLTQPGMIIVCGDSHTSTHGAFGALAFGIGTSEVEHVLATQCLVMSKPKTLEAHFTGRLAPGVTAKDLVLGFIGRIGTAGATAHVIEYTGEPIRAFSMEERMTVCNMSIEAGARAGMIAPDETTFAYLAGRPRAPSGAAWTRAIETWRGLASDPGATYDTRVVIDAAQLAPQVTWGTSPGMVTAITARVPKPERFRRPMPIVVQRRRRSRIWASPAGHPLEGLPIDRVFLGSCTNGRIEDLRAAARVVRGKHVASTVRAMVVPGSMTRQSAGRARGTRPRVPRGGLRVAQRGLLDVPGHEPRHPTERRAVRLDLQPQLRRAPGTRRAHAPREPRDGRRRRGRRLPRGCARLDSRGSFEPHPLAPALHVVERAGVR